jgi:hypothetical protein
MGLVGDRRVRVSQLEVIQSVNHRVHTPWHYRRIMFSHRAPKYEYTREIFAKERRANETKARGNERKNGNIEHMK